jgi:hypothetical protein
MNRILAMALLATGWSGMGGPAPAQTAVSQYAFCIQNQDYPGWTGCSFNTIEACQAMASGTVENAFQIHGTKPVPTFRRVPAVAKSARAPLFPLDRLRIDRRLLKRPSRSYAGNGRWSIP